MKELDKYFHEEYIPQHTQEDITVDEYNELWIKMEQDMEALGIYKECGYGCEMLGYTCAGNPKENSFCSYYDWFFKDEPITEDKIVELLKGGK